MQKEKRVPKRYRKSNVSFRKFIVTHAVEFGRTRPDQMGPFEPTYFANGFIVPNNYSRSLDSYKLLVAEARKAFPWLKNSNVECLVVLKSWRQIEGRLPDIQW